VEHAVVKAVRFHNRTSFETWTAAVAARRALLSLLRHRTEFAQGRKGDEFLAFGKVQLSRRAVLAEEKPGAGSGSRAFAPRVAAPMLQMAITD
jgi:hypothetical protein